MDTSPRVLLAPFSWLWGAVVGLRSALFECGWLKQRSFDVPVICVGNLEVGGTGKTPHVEYILRLLHAQGLRTAMLSRGYGRATHGFRQAKADSTAAEIGDEPWQIFHNCPFATVAVCERRTEGIDRLLAASRPPQVIVLDDAFQHRHVRAGLNILLTSAARLYTADHLLPWGRLREPASAARRAQLIVVTKCGEGQRPALPVGEGQQLFYSHTRYGTPYPCFPPDAETADGGRAEEIFRGRSVVVVAAIAHPAPLAGHIAAQEAASVAVLPFPDHHRFTPDDARRIARAAGADGLIATTQKDAPRLTALAPHLPADLRRRIWVQPITVSIQPARTADASFNQRIIHYVTANQRNG